MMERRSPTRYADATDLLKSLRIFPAGDELTANETNFTRALPMRSHNRRLREGRQRALWAVFILFLTGLAAIARGVFAQNQASPPSQFTFSFLMGPAALPI
jgi:hypothetical protein